MRGRLPTLVAAVAGTVVLAGCSGPPARMVTRVPSPVDSTTLVGMSPQEVLEASVAAADDATAVRIRARTHDEGGSTLIADVGLAWDIQASGTLTVDDAAFAVRRVEGRMWLRPRGTTWTELWNLPAGAGKTLDGRWLRIREKDAPALFFWTDRDAVLGQLETSFPDDLRFVPGPRIAGAGSLGLTDLPVAPGPRIGTPESEEDERRTVYVPPDGVPRPVRIEYAPPADGRPADRIDLSDYVEPVQVEPPGDDFELPRGVAQDWGPTRSEA